MRFTDTAIDNIESAKWVWVAEHGKRGVGIKILNDCFGEACVYHNDHYLFKVSEMWAVVKELNAMVDIVKDTVGIYEEA